MPAPIVCGRPLPASDLRPTPTVRVHSAVELRSALHQARVRRLAIDSSDLDRVLRLDCAGGLIEVQGCATWHALAAQARQAGCDADAFASAENLAPTVGESVTLNAPGPDGRPIASHVEAITLVTADGELRRAGLHGNRELLQLVLGGHGVFGVLYSVTLRLASLAHSARHAQREIVHDWLAARSPRTLEVLVPPQELDRFLDSVRTQAAERCIELAGVRIRHTLAECETFLRWATREFAWVALQLRARPTLHGGVQLSEAQRSIIAEALRLGGTFPIASGFAASPDQVQACYPQLAAFLAAKRRYDPAELLLNDWYRHFRRLLAPRCAVRWAA